MRMVQIIRMHEFYKGPAKTAWELGRGQCFKIFIFDHNLPIKFPVSQLSLIYSFLLLCLNKMALPGT